MKIYSPVMYLITVESEVQSSKRILYPTSWPVRRKVWRKGSRVSDMMKWDKYMLIELEVAIRGD